MTFEKLESIYSKLQLIQEIISANLTEISKSYNLNTSELMMVVDIKTYPGTNLQSVCDRLGLKKSLASKTLKKLVEEGVILRSPDSLDQRKVALSYNGCNEISICKEEALAIAFNSKIHCDSDLQMIETSLADLLEMLTKR